MLHESGKWGWLQRAAAVQAARAWGTRHSTASVMGSSELPSVAAGCKPWRLLSSSCRASACGCEVQQVMRARQQRLMHLRYCGPLTPKDHVGGGSCPKGRQRMEGDGVRQHEWRELNGWLLRGPCIEKKHTGFSSESVLRGAWQSHLPREQQWTALPSSLCLSIFCVGSVPNFVHACARTPHPAPAKEEQHDRGQVRGR